MIHRMRSAAWATLCVSSVAFAESYGNVNSLAALMLVGPVVVAGVVFFIVGRIGGAPWIASCIGFATLAYLDLVPEGLSTFAATLLLVQCVLVGFFWGLFRWWTR